MCNIFLLSQLLFYGLIIENLKIIVIVYIDILIQYKLFFRKSRFMSL